MSMCLLTIPAWRLLRRFYSMTSYPITFPLALSMKELYIYDWYALMRCRCCAFVFFLPLSILGLRFCYFCVVVGVDRSELIKVGVSAWFPRGNLAGLVLGVVGVGSKQCWHLPACHYQSILQPPLLKQQLLGASCCNAEAYDCRRLEQ
ncbi:hypothetical protein K440DRAFT_151369 [Wilcoxina mikolae CBS 423.85]|nr:hypothetical protein K440DRAFT_151369 [Wilcoxina mikolae CBS 423.85]